MNVNNMKFQQYSMPKHQQFVQSNINITLPSFEEPLLENLVANECK